jgi:pimeloyl-ACP methyl ester carboxylesterase
MSKVALLTIHGMGEQPLDYADDMRRALSHRMGASFANVDMHSVYYQHLLKPNELDVWNRTRERATVRYEQLRKFILFGFADAAGLENRKEYDNSVYEQAQMEIARALLAILATRGPDTPIVLLAHSLGCQVMSSFIYDAQKRAGGGAVAAGIWKPGRMADSLTAEQRKFLQCGTVRTFVTTGCNIPVFVSAHQRMDVKPIIKPNPGFTWLNLYDPDDALGWPLQPLEGGYETLVEDRVVNAGQGILDFMTKSWNPLSHTAYWTDDEIIKPLATLLS